MRFVSSLLLLPLLLLAGCDGFFFKTSSTAGGSSSGNYAFVANMGSNTVSGFSISKTGALTTLPGSPITLGTVPTAVTVSRSNTYLWVGTISQIFGYSIASNGTLTALNSGVALANANCTDMQTTPDGKWLMVLDGSGAGIDLFAINADGTLSASSGIGFTPTGTVVPRQLRIAPSGSFVVADMGTAGEVIYAFKTATGALTYLSQTTPPTLTSDNGIAIDSTGTYLYTVRSGNSAGLVVFSIASNGALTPTTSTLYATGSQPYAVTIDSMGKYVYVANRTDGTITGYGIGTNAALTALSGSPYSAGVGVSALGADSSGSWMLAAAYGGAPDLTLYGYDSTNLGRLYTVSSVSTGTYPSVLALSH